MSLEVIGSYPVGAFNVGASAAVGVGLNLVLALEASLFGAFGLSSTLLDLQLQADASAQFALDLGLSISDPTAGFRLAASALVQLQASIEAALAINFSIDISLNASISASVSLQAALEIRLGGIRLAIEAALAIKGPAVDLFGQLQAQLSAGPVVILSNIDGGPNTLQELGENFAAKCSVGIGDPLIAPTDPTYIIIIATKEPSASASLQAMFLVS